MDQPKKRTPLLISLKQILENTSDYTGQLFFESLVKNLAEILDVYAVWVTKYDADAYTLDSYAFWMRDKMIEEYCYNVKGTPCEPVLTNEGIYHIPDLVIDLFPDDPDLKPMGAVSYMGIALKDIDGTVMGHLAMMDDQPMEEMPEVFAVFEIFAARAAAEMRRLKFEDRLQDSEAKLNRLVNGTMDAIIELDKDGTIVQYNQAALKTFEVIDRDFAGKPISHFLHEKGYEKILNLMPHLKMLDQRPNSLWVQGHLTCITARGDAFPAEATLSSYKNDGQEYYALYIRNVKDRLQDQEEIRKLNVETTMLREKINARQFEDIIGESVAILQSLEMVKQVAPTDSTVLVLGETGTGKELFARAIHNASRRRDKALVTLNCAALPSELIESELFGHVKGAFTGASQARQGRFALADGGTLFLDEIGELPLSLQAKLLRVIQEGEFQPVGSSNTEKVDVRIVTATHRDLAEQVQDGKFREDLFYRLNVFPIQVPPLRDRQEDIILLAEAFIQKYSQSSGLEPLKLDSLNKEALMSYPWPGNVRELQNIIERGVITSQNGKLNLVPLLTLNTGPVKSGSKKVTKILTDAELKELEKKNILTALKACNGKVSGKDGAAALLGIPGTTLSSKIKKYDLAPTY